MIILHLLWENVKGDMMTNSEQVDIYNVIGKNIKKYRKMKNWTQHELADKLLLCDSFISKLESKTRQTISIDTLYQISLILDTDIKNFFDK